MGTITRMGSAVAGAKTVVLVAANGARDE